MNKELIIDSIKKITNEMIRIFNKIFNLKKRQLFEFGHVKILNRDDYSFYETFFSETNKGATLEGWLEEYFMLKASKNILMDIS